MYSQAISGTAPLNLTALLCLSLFGLVSCGNQTDIGATNEAPVTLSYQKWADTKLDSLDDLSIEKLRTRHYTSTLEIETRLGDVQDDSEYSRYFSMDGSPPYNTYLASYRSDGNRIYSRVDVPASPPPADGYPVMIFVHGWVGLEEAPGFDFGYKAGSMYSRYIDAFADAGFLVLTPGWRGHGTVNNVPAEGIGFIQTWDNGSYISPIFYAIDVLNLIEGIQSLETIDWSKWGIRTGGIPRANTNRIHINGHSQGGDVALTVLAVSGEQSSIRNAVSSGSIWSGCIGTRFGQASIYGPMASTLEAFMSGDGTWTGNALGRDGSINPNFVFAWPPDWIGTLDTNSPQWTWQADTWKLETVAESLQIKFSEMYEAINRSVDDINDASFEIFTADNGKTEVRHDQGIINAMFKVSAYNYPQYLTEPILFHHSDQDYYSIPEWNADLSARINAIGGFSHDFNYPGNTHSLLVSQHEWFSKEGTIEGFGEMIKRDLDLQGNSGLDLKPEPQQ